MCSARQTTFPLEAARIGRLSVGDRVFPLLRFHRHHSAIHLGFDGVSGDSSCLGAANRMVAVLVVRTASLALSLVPTGGVMEGAVSGLIAESPRSLWGNGGGFASVSFAIIS